MAVKTETDFQAFLATMRGYPDDALLAAAVVTLATRPAGPFGQRTHDELRAEVERRDMSEFVDLLVNAAIDEGQAIVDESRQRAPGGSSAA